MAICRYRQCGKDFEPNPRNRTKNIQAFCCTRHRVLEWMLENPRPSQIRKEMEKADAGKGK
jgi:hypothetical protein